MWKWIIAAAGIAAITALNKYVIDPFFDDLYRQIIGTSDYMEEEERKTCH